MLDAAINFLAFDKNLYKNFLNLKSLFFGKMHSYYEMEINLLRELSSLKFMDMRKSKNQVDFCCYAHLHLKCSHMRYK